MSQLLTNKNIVIYGAAGALGTGIAKTFAAEGASLSLVGRTQETLDATAQEALEHGGRVEVAVLDALDEQAVTDHLETVGRIDVSFNLIFRGDVQGTPLVDMAVDDLLAPVNNGLKSNFITARAAARRMATQGRGTILMLNSGSRGGGAPTMGGTGPADASQDAFLRLLAAEVGTQGVRVVGLYTAGVRETFEFERSTNPMLKTHNLTTELMEQMLGQRTMLGRLPRLAEVADTAAFLASDKASGITGTTVSVTCGLVGTFA